MPTVLKGEKQFLCHIVAIVIKQVPISHINGISRIFANLKIKTPGSMKL